MLIPLTKYELDRWFHFSKLRNYQQQQQQQKEFPLNLDKVIIMSKVHKEEGTQVPLFDINVLFNKSSEKKATLKK